MWKIKEQKIISRMVDDIINSFIELSKSISGIHNLRINMDFRTKFKHICHLTRWNFFAIMRLKNGNGIQINLNCPDPA